MKNRITNPRFNNSPNNHLRLSYLTNHGNMKLDYWISRAPAVVGIIFTMTDEGLNVLLIKRSNKMREEPNKYGAPSGYLDWDETGFQAITREIFEETSMYLPDYNEFLIYDNEEQPFYVLTDPTKDKNQNVSLLYINVYDFSTSMDSFPRFIENYQCKETAEVKWLRLHDFYTWEHKYEWAFNHNDRIKLALKHFNGKR